MNVETKQVVPLTLMRWASEEWVARLLQEAGISLTAVLDIDPNQRISSLGSRMLHLVAMSPHRPSEDVTLEVMKFLLNERGGDPNVPDDYGRTPLILFISRARNSWSENEQFGVDVLSLLFAHGADANVYFTPDVVHVAGCAKWTLAHHLNDRYHGNPPLPPRMRQLLEAKLDRTLPDSEGRTGEVSQFMLDV